MNHFPLISAIWTVLLGDVTGLQVELSAEVRRRKWGSVCFYALVLKSFVVVNFKFKFGITVKETQNEFITFIVSTR